MTSRPRVQSGRWRVRRPMQIGGGLSLVLWLTASCAYWSSPAPRTTSATEPSQKSRRIATWLGLASPAPEPAEPPLFEQIQPPLVGSVALPARWPDSPVGPAQAAGANPTSPALVGSGQAPTTPTARTPASVLTSATAEQILAGLVHEIVTATEEHNPRLREIDLELDQINREMTDLYHSEGWELELESRQSDVDATRRDSRAGRSYRLDGTPRKAHNFFDDLDESESEFIIRLTRSWGHPDHEKYVKIALKRLAKFDAVMRKQDLRRDLHMATLDTILDVLARRAVLPLMEERIALARQKLEKLENYYKQREALRKDVLDARRDLERLQWQLYFHREGLDLSLAELRASTDIRQLDLVTTLPFCVRPQLPDAGFDAQAATSVALQQRLDYFLGEKRVQLVDTLARYMAWYWPTVNFEISWNEFHGHRHYLDETRRDKGKEFGTELRLEVPLNVVARGRARQQAFQAQRERYKQDLQILRGSIEGDVRGAYLARMQANVNCLDAQNVLQQAIETARVDQTLAEKLPFELQGIPEIRELDSAMKVVDARMDLRLAETELFRTRARWNYLVGNSPIDTAVEPFLARERRAVEKRKWYQWWTSLIK